MAQAQTVVVMVPQGQAVTGPEGTGVGAGEVAAQAVVVAPSAVAIANQTTNRYPRWGFLMFSIGLGAWNFVSMWFSLAFVFFPGEISTMSFFCVFLPSLLVFTMTIVDSTTHCNNPPGAAITKICCCVYSGPNGILIPVAASAILRLIFWLWLGGNFLAWVEVSAENPAVVDNAFFFVLSMAAFDVGPIILFAIDFFYYYKKEDYEGIFGHKIKPLRVVISQSTLIVIISWSFVLLFNGVARNIPDLHERIWQWILHAVVSTIILVFALAMHFGGLVQGTVPSSPMVRYACMVAGVAQLIVVIIVFVDMLSVLGDLGEAGAIGTLVWLIFVTYYGGNTVPMSFALFQIKDEPQNNDPPPPAV